MKNYTFLVVTLILLLILSACSTTEEIWMNKDGSLRREIKMDIGPLMAFTDMMDDEDEQMAIPEEEPGMILPKLKNLDETKSESMEEEKDFGQRMDDLLEQEYVDTLINFSSLLEEELKKEGITLDELMKEGLLEEDIPDEEDAKMIELARSLYNSQLGIKINRAAGVFEVRFIDEFASLSEMSEGVSALQTLYELGSEGEEIGDTGVDGMIDLVFGTPTKYTKISRRKLSISRPPMVTPSMGEEGQESMQMVMGLMGGMEYTIVFHAPRKIRKVNVGNAIIDGNTMTVEVPASTGEGAKEFEVTVKYK